MASVYYMPKRFCPGMPKLRLEMAGGARPVRPLAPAIGTPEYDESVKRAQEAQLHERLVHHLCITCGTPLQPQSSQPCAACVLATFTSLAGLES